MEGVADRYTRQKLQEDYLVEERGNVYKMIDVVSEPSQETKLHSGLHRTTGLFSHTNRSSFYSELVTDSFLGIRLHYDLRGHPASRRATGPRR